MCKLQTIPKVFRSCRYILNLNHVSVKKFAFLNLWRRPSLTTGVKGITSLPSLSFPRESLGAILMQRCWFPHLLDDGSWKIVECEFFKHGSYTLWIMVRYRSVPFLCGLRVRRSKNTDTTLDFLPYLSWVVVFTEGMYVDVQWFQENAFYSTTNEH